MATRPKAKQQEFWLVTYREPADGAIFSDTLDQHPADWMAKLVSDNEGVHLLFAIPISEKQYDRFAELEEAGDSSNKFGGW